MSFPKTPVVEKKFNNNMYYIKKHLLTMFRNLTSILTTLFIFVLVASSIVIFGTYFKEKENFTEDDIDVQENDIAMDTSPSPSTTTSKTKTKSAKSNSKKNKKSKQTDMIEHVKKSLIKDLDNMKASVELSIQSIIQNLDIDPDEGDVSESDQVIISTNESDTPTSREVSVSETVEVKDIDISEDESVSEAEADDANGDEEEESSDSDNEDDDDTSRAANETGEDAEEDIEEFENYMTFEQTRQQSMSPPSRKNQKKNMKKSEQTLRKKQKTVDMSTMGCQGITSAYCLNFSTI